MIICKRTTMTRFNEFLAYIGLNDHTVLAQEVNVDDPAFQYALKKLLSLKNYDAVIADCLIPIRERIVQQLQYRYNPHHPRFIELLMIKFIIEIYLYGDRFLPGGYRIDAVRSKMFKLLPVDMAYFPHEYIRADFKTRVIAIQSLPNTRGKALLLEAITADPQWWYYTEYH